MKKLGGKIMTVIIAMGIGILIGWFSRLTITINHHQIEQPKNQIEIAYNESMAEHLDPEIRRYYDNTNGLNKF
jgi:hypothetical protein